MRCPPGCARAIAAAGQQSGRDKRDENRAEESARGTHVFIVVHRSSRIVYAESSAMRIAAFLMSVVTAASLAAQSGKRYRITHSYVLGGDGSWDYVVPDPPNHRLFIGRQNRVMVVDEAAGTVFTFNGDGPVLPDTWSSATADRRDR